MKYRPRRKQNGCDKVGYECRAMVTFTTRYETLGCLVISLSPFAQTSYPSSELDGATHSLDGGCEEEGRAISGRQILTFCPIFYMVNIWTKRKFCSQIECLRSPPLPSAIDFFFMQYNSLHMTIFKPKYGFFDMKE